MASARLDRPGQGQSESQSTGKPTTRRVDYLTPAHFSTSDAPKRSEKTTEKCSERAGTRENRTRVRRDTPDIVPPSC